MNRLLDKLDAIVERTKKGGGELVKLDGYLLRFGMLRCCCSSNG